MTPPPEELAYEAANVMLVLSLSMLSPVAYNADYNHYFHCTRVD
eukprot:COSAG02_NODE_23723_length_710_cov_0.900164_1_plen_43_part_10